MIAPSLVVNSTTVLRTSVGEPNWWGRPSVAVKDGVVIMVYRGATGHIEGDGALYIKFSDDYGATWSDENKTLAGASVTNFPMNPSDASPGEDSAEPRLYLAPNGDLVLHMWRHDWGVQGHGTYQATSTDSGHTWTIATHVTFAGYPGGALTYAADDYFVYNDVMYAGAREMNNIGMESGYRIFFIKSEDNGATWDFLSYITAFSPGGSEIGLEYIGNNSIVSIIRGNSKELTYRSYSYDMGATWTAIETIGYAIGNSGRHRIFNDSKLRGLPNWWNDERLVMCGFVFTPTQRRSCLWFSKDAGKSWSLPQYVDTTYGDAGYGDVFWNPLTGEYVFLCYRGTTAKADLVQYRVSVDWGQNWPAYR